MSVIDLKTGAPARWHALQVEAYNHMGDDMELDFEEDSHTYFRFERKIPSVTQILWDMGAIPEFSTFSEFARDRGTAVHQACALLPDRLDWTTVDARIHGYLESYMRFLDTCEIKITGQEQRGYNKELGYAGTLDLKCEYDWNGTLYLQADGKLAKFAAHTDRRAWHTFVSMVNVYHWRKNGRN